MSAKSKGKILADLEDAEVASILQLQLSPNADPGQWLRDKQGDLDWTYTARTVRKWSHDALLTHLWENSFSIPARDYNPSAPFVYIRLHDGNVVTLPHGYRLPLMFVVRYLWDITLDSVKDKDKWKKERASVFHLSRLCENLFQRARAKAIIGGGMEKGWRCVMFDRLLARFYKHFYWNDPPSGKQFVSQFGIKEYDRDVLKHDWKRWCRRGLNGVKMTEEEVVNGITITEFRRTLKKGDDGIWSIQEQSLTYITAEEDPSYSSTSDLTDYDMDDDEVSDDAEGQEFPEQAEEDPFSSTSSPSPEDIENSPTKRPRYFPVDEDEVERASKRARIENVADESHYRYKHNHIYPLTRTLAAMAKRNTTSSGSAPGAGLAKESESAAGSSRLPETSPQSASATLMSRVRSFRPDVGAGSAHVAKLPNGTSHSSPSAAPATDADNLDGSESVTVVSTQTKSIFSQAPQQFEPFTSQNRPTSTSTSSSASKSKTPKKGDDPAYSFLSALRRSAPKPRQTRAAQTAGVATVNVYVPERGVGLAHASALRAQAQSPAQIEAIRQIGPRADLSKMRKLSSSARPAVVEPEPEPEPAPNPASEPASASVTNLTSESTSKPLPTTTTTKTSTIATTLTAAATTTTPTVAAAPMHELAPGLPVEPASGTGVGSETGPKSWISQDAINAKALELLVNLVDVKEILKAQLQLPSSSIPPTLPASTVTDRSTDPSTTTTTPNAAASTTSSGSSIPSTSQTEPEQRLLESKFHDFEGRFLSVKEELIGIVGRLQTLEKKTREQQENEHQMKSMEALRVLRDETAECRPARVEQETQTVGGGTNHAQVDVEMGSPEAERAGGAKRSGYESAEPQRTFEESAIQTEEGPERRPAPIPAGFIEVADIGVQVQIANNEPPSVSSTSTLVEIQVDSTSGSDTDTDMTINAATSLLKEEIVDARTQVMSSNLSLLVDNLVSAKMLSVMNSMVKSKRTADPSCTTSEQDMSNRSTSPSTTLNQPGEPAFLVTTLLDELKVLKDESRVRAQREKEEMEAMRQLHSAEVDALRRRLSYLESQNRNMDGMSGAAGGGGSISVNARHRDRSSSSHGSRHADSTGSGSGGHHRISTPVPGAEPSDGVRHGDLHRYDYPNGRTHTPFSPARAAYGATGESDNASLTEGAGAGSSGGMNLVPTPTLVERTFSFTRPSSDRDREDDIPLPIKSQRKHHISFPRPHFG